jgi:hypothetical protein
MKKKNNTTWKAIFIPLLIPLVMLNLAPLAVVLFASDNRYSAFAGLALYPSLVIAFIVDLTAFSVYMIKYNPHSTHSIAKRIIIDATLIILGLVLIVSAVIAYLWSSY